MPDVPVLKDLLSRDLHRFSPDMTIADAVALMIDYGISGAPVVDNTGELVGILTSKDCFRAALNASYHQGWTSLVVGFMTTEVKTLDADTDVTTAAQCFLEHEFRRFPVLSDGRLIGMITRSDILGALAGQLM